LHPPRSTCSDPTSAQRSISRGSGLSPAGPSTALLVALVASGEREQGLLSFASQALVFTMPLTAVFFGAAAFWSYSAVDQRERRLLDQLGEPADRRSPMARAARSAGRAAIAVLMGIILTPLILFPVRILLLLVSLLGLPVDAIPEQVGLALGVVAIAVVAACSYRWLRSNPASPLRLEEGTDI
jgi:protein-S-isoprenylcysteine O-methyltransferase Ste14